MGTEDLLVGNMAIAAILIKTIISSIKNVVSLETKYVYMLTLFLGMLSVFSLDINLISTVDQTVFMDITQKILAGIFVASSSMGIHETTKVIKKNAKK